MWAVWVMCVKFFRQGAGKTLGKNVAAQLSPAGAILDHGSSRNSRRRTEESRGDERCGTHRNRSFRQNTVDKRNNCHPFVNPGPNRSPTDL